MSRIQIHGKETLPKKPVLLIPNRLSERGLLEIYKMLKGQLCILVDESFPLDASIQGLIDAKDILCADFHLRKAQSSQLRERILAQFDAGRYVLFIPGQIERIRGCLSDVPSPYLKHLSSLHLSPVPLYTSYFGSDIHTFFSAKPLESGREILCILPQLSSGPQMGERMLSAWMNCSADQVSQHELISGSLTTALVRSLKAHPKAETIDGMTHTKLPNFKLLGVAMAVARYLKTLDIKRVGVILPPGPGATIVTTACLLAQITPVMINYASSRASFESTCRQAELKYFVSANKFIEKLPQFSWPPREQMIIVEDLLKKMSKSTLVANVLTAKVAPAWLICRMFDTEKRRGDDEAVLLFTSGSSGEPKGVKLSHRMILANTAQCACRITLENEKFLASLPVFHSFGLTVTMFLPLLTGFDICCYPNPTDAKTLCELAERYKLTLLCATPTFARAMLRRAKPQTFASVRYFVVGAEKLPDDLRDEFKKQTNVDLLEGYGLTEAAPVCSVNMHNIPLPAGSNYYIPGCVKGSIGTPLPGIAIRMTDLDDDEKEIPLTQRGMIWLKGANVFDGYINNPQANRGIFSGDWFKTGDIGELDLNGFIRLGGRLARFSKVAGEMIPHEGVEEILRDILQIDPAAPELSIAVTGVSDVQKGEALVLLSCLPEHQHRSGEQEFLMEIRHAMPAQKVPQLWSPKYIVPVESIPILPTGKLDLSACKWLAQAALGCE